MDLHFGIFLQQEAKTKQNFLVTVDFWQNYMHYTEIVGKKKTLQGRFRVMRLNKFKTIPVFLF